MFHFNTKNLLRCGEYILQNYVFVDFGGDDSNHGNTSNETNQIMMSKMSLCWIISVGIRTRYS